MELIKKAQLLIAEELLRLKKAREQFMQQVRDLETEAVKVKGFLSRTVTEIEELEQHLADVAKASLEPVVQVVEKVEAEIADDLHDILGEHDAP